MALEFDLSISTEFEPMQTLQILSQRLGLERDSNMNLLAAGVSVSAITKSALGQSVIEDGFGFRPNIAVCFRIYPNEDYEQGKVTLLRATVELLSQVRGDAVLLFNGEEIVLQRIEENLLLNQDKSIWSPLQLSKITLPYELRSLPSPLL